MDEFRKAENWLNSIFSEASFFRRNKPPSLESTNLILDYLNRPDRSFSWRIVVSGTAGKGTVCRTCEELLIRSRKKVATLISPHVQVVTERIRINGQLVAPEDFTQGVFAIKSAAEAIHIQPTYYEAVVLTGVFIAWQHDCEILICEVGLGGEFDAVNAVQGPRIAALTFAGEDHMEILGPTLADVARTKAGIFTSDSVYNISYEKTFHHILEEVAKTKVELIEGPRTKLNSIIAHRICEKVLNTSDIECNDVRAPACWEEVSKFPTVILDGAHSNPRFGYLLPKIAETPGHKVAIIALTKNHEADLSTILKEFDEIFFCDQIRYRDCWPASELIKKFGQGKTISSDPIETFHKVTTKYNNSTIIVVGSFYLCGEIRNLFYSPEEIIKQQTVFPLMINEKT
jgi:dihydrofolate synthase / folylpolyglutamate synthase